MPVAAEVAEAEVAEAEVAGAEVDVAVVDVGGALGVGGRVVGVPQGPRCNQRRWYECRSNQRRCHQCRSNQRLGRQRGYPARS